MKGLSLQNRMRLALLGLASLVACFNLSFLWGVSKWSEDYIFEKLLEKEVAAALQAISKNEQPKTQTAFFQYYATLDDIPEHFQEWASTLSPGYHEADEFVYDYSAFAAVSDEADTGRFYILGDVGNAEYMESHGDQVLQFALVSLGISIVLAYLISGYLSARAIKPIRQLAHKIESSNAPASIAGLSQGLPNDEIGTLARAFERAHDSIASFAEREQRFTGDVSHELRTPLMAASNAMQIAIDDTQQGRQPELKHLERAHRNLDKMTQLVRTFLTLARAEDSGHTSETIELKPMILETVESIRQTYPLKDIEFDIQCPNNALVWGKREFAQVMISNILSNAVQYASGKSICIDVSVANTKTNLAVSNEFPNADTLDFELLRERFQRGETANQAHGYGIGLSIVQRVSEATGWPCNLRSSAANRITAIVEMDAPGAPHS